MSTPKKTIYRDSLTGKILSKPDALKKDPATWEKERVPAK
jgi:hypothetical protein